MKLYTVDFYDDNDGDGADRAMYGVFDSYEMAYKALEKIVEKDGHDINKLWKCPDMYLYGALLKLQPKYGVYTIREKELNQIYYEG